MKNRQWSAVLFWGGLWGISEATVSYLLHLFAPGFGWVFYYPLAYAFMYGVYRQSGKAGSILWAAALSAAIKLINLFMAPRIDYVINPAVSILMEGLVMFCAVKLTTRQSYPVFNMLAIPAGTSLCWRGFYLLYLLAAPAWIREASVLADTSELWKFLLLETTVNTVLISVGSLAAHVTRRMQKEKNKPDFRLSEQVFGGISVAVVCLACFLQWAL